MGDSFPGIALPSVKALRMWVAIKYKDKVTYAQCYDVGPWCIDDEAYVFDGATPRAETYKGKYCPLKEGSSDLATVPDGKGGMKPVPICNGAAIDLFPRVAKELGIALNDNVQVEWSFIEDTSVV